jgi:D-alanyl-D-alanine dipeptidase
MQTLPEGFTYLSQIDDSILFDIKYSTSDNFLGRPADGYKANVVICTIAAANKLKLVQQDVRKLGYSLKVLDAYRPHRAVEDFWNWAHDPKDTLMKAEYYPSFENKADLFNGYLARYSGHSRGSTIDVTLVRLIDNCELDMGTRFDFLGVESHTAYQDISEEAKDNRMLLKEAMERYGFENYSKEWWHFSLIDEPFKRKPEDHFDFEVL